MRWLWCIGLSLLVGASCSAGDGADVQPDAPTAIDSGRLDSGADVASGTTPAVSAAPVYEFSVTSGVVYGKAGVANDWEGPDYEQIDLTLDVYQPVNAPGPRPAMILIHGGGFKAGSSTSGTMIKAAEYFAPRGFVCFSINYRMAGDHGQIPAAWPDPPPEGLWPGGVKDEGQWYALYTGGRDAKAAVRFVHARAGDYAVNPDHITVLGGSAGAYLALTAGIASKEDYLGEMKQDEDPTLEECYPNARHDVHTIIDFWGGTALLDIKEFLDGQSRFDATDAPLIIFHGEQDTTVPFSQAQKLVQEYGATGVPYEFHGLEAGHAAWGEKIDGRSMYEVALDFIIAQQGLGLR